MHCPHCGAEVPSGSGFCYACRKRLADPAGRAPQAGAGTAPSGTSSLDRPGLVTGIAVLNLLGALGTLLLLGLLAWAAISEPAQRLGFALGALVAALFVLLQAACGFGLLALKPFARPLQITLAVLSICSPISIGILIYMLRPGVRVLFSGRSGADLSSAERELAQRDGAVGGSSVVVVVVVVVLGFLVVPVLGIVAAIAIPALLQARVAANEAANKGDARSVVSAQMTYASESDGSFAPRLECLVTPRTCLPGYLGGAMLDASVATSPSRGYVRRLLVPSGAGTFVYVAVPQAPGQSGLRSFCADQTGLICATRDSQAFDDLDGSGCPAFPLCEPL